MKMETHLLGYFEMELQLKCISPFLLVLLTNRLKYLNNAIFCI